jgi:hypothetical protein
MIESSTRASGATRPEAVARRPRFTFGVIVLNGEPFVRYALDALYPHAHQIIVVEGAAPAAAAVATARGHSSDSTLATLQAYKRERDPEAKLTIVTAEDQGHPDGFWPGEKHEQCAAFAERAIGDYLWQVDVDEFYQPEDIEAVRRLLTRDPSITQMAFRQVTFWGAPRYCVDGIYLRRGAGIYHRLFKWGPGYRYINHRPPTVIDAAGRDLRTLHLVDGSVLAARGIILYHYSLLFPKQVIEKTKYYGAAAWAGQPQAEAWTRAAYLTLGRPYRVHNVDAYPSWIERFAGAHPPAAVQMWDDAVAGRLDIERRPTQDIERLLRSPTYRAGRLLLKGMAIFGSSPAGLLASRALQSARRRLRPLRSAFGRGPLGPRAS